MSLGFQSTPLTLTAIVLAIACLATAFYAWRARDTFGSVALFVLALLAAVWSLSYGAEVAHTDFATKSAWARLEFFCAACAPVLWLAVAANGTQSGSVLLGRRRWLLWLIIPALMLLLMATNDWHHLLWQDVLIPQDGAVAPLRMLRGPFFWLNAFYVLGICLVVIMLATAAVIRLPIFRRRYVAAVLAGAALPWLGNTLYLAGLDLLAPAAYLLGGLTMAWGLYQIRQLNLVPLARSAIVEQMPDGVLVLDDHDRVLDCNLAAQRLLGMAGVELVGRAAAEILPISLDEIERISATQAVPEEVTLGEHVCELSVTPITDRLKRTIGRLVALHDITDRLRAAEELDQRTAELQIILQAVPDFMFRLDREGRFVGYAASPGAQLALLTDQLVGRSIDEVLPSAVGYQIKAALQRVYEEGTPQAVDYSLTVGDVTSWYEARLFPARRDEIISVVRDVTERKRADMELREQKELLENLVKVARATSEQPTLEATLHNVLQVGVTLTGADRGSLFILDDAGTVTQTLFVRDEAPIVERRVIIERLMQGGLAGWVARERRSAVVYDTLQDDRWLPLPDEMPTRSVLAVPILSEQILLGVLVLCHAQPAHYTAEHARLLEAAAVQMALSIRNARLFDTQQRMAERQTTLYEVLRAVSGQLDASLIAQTAAEAIAHFAGWPHVALLLADVEGRNWIVRAVKGAPSLPLGFTLPIAPEVIRRTGFSSAAPAGKDSSSFELIDLIGRDSTGAQLIVPLWHGGRLSGILSIEGSAETTFDADDLSLAQSLADAVALALDNARLYEDINDERSRLQASIRFNRDGIALLGMNQRVLVINEPALRLLGLPGQADDWLNRSLHDAVQILRHRTPAAVKAILGEMRRVQQGSEPPAEGEYEVSPRMIHWTSLPVLSHSVPIGRLIVLRDVTEERLLESMREDLTNTMVHDLRNPATVVLGALDLLESEELSADQQEIVSVAQQGGQRLLNLVTAILDVNRLEGGQMPLEREPVRLQVIAGEALELQSILAKDKHQTLENGIDPDFPLVVIDVELVRRVLQNLIGNAVKFTPPGGSIRVEARVDPANSRQAVITVADNGPGVALDIQPRLFQKFVTGRVRGRGSGLGLAFCRLVAEAHGGNIWVESLPGHGAKFMFTLPIAED
jgi:two-component system, NtrC family, sensor histidine kinase KinB